MAGDSRGHLMNFQKQANYRGRKDELERKKRKSEKDKKRYQAMKEARASEKVK